MNGKTKSLLGSILVIGIVTALITIGTQSYFTDTETSKRNIFTAGTIDISINPKRGQQVTTLTGDLDLKPCQTGYIKILIRNDGTNPCEVWKHIFNVENFENGLVEPEREYYNEWKNENPNWENENLIPPWKWKISDWIHYDMIVCKLPPIEKIETDDFVITKEVGCGNVTWTVETVTNELQLVVVKSANNSFKINWSVSGEQHYYEWTVGGWIEKPWPAEITITYNAYGVVTIKISTKYIGFCGKIFGWGMLIDGYQYPANWSGIYDPFQNPAKNQLGELLLIIPEDEGWFLTTNKTLEHQGVECYWIYLGVLQPGETICVIQSYHLNYSVGNWGQSDKISFDIEFLAQQIEGGIPPQPDPTLPGHGRP